MKTYLLINAPFRVKTSFKKRIVRTARGKAIFVGGRRVLRGRPIKVTEEFLRLNKKQIDELVDAGIIIIKPLGIVEANKGEETIEVKEGAAEEAQELKEDAVSNPPNEVSEATVGEGDSTAEEESVTSAEEIAVEESAVLANTEENRPKKRGRRRRSKKDE